MLEGFDQCIVAIQQQIAYVEKTMHWSNQLKDQLVGLNKALELIYDLRDDERERIRGK